MFRSVGRTILLVLIIILLAACLFLGWQLYSARFDDSGTSSRTTQFGLRSIGELTTQEGYFTNVQTISDTRKLFGISFPFTGKKYVYSYDGVVKAGVDFERVSVTVDEAAKVIAVTLPEPEIFSVSVDPDSFVSYVDGDNLFNSLKVEDINRAQRAMIEEVRRKAVDNGLLENARSNAELLITGFVAGAYDLNEYRLEFRTLTEEAAQ